LKRLRAEAHVFTRHAEDIRTILQGKGPRVEARSDRRGRGVDSDIKS